VQFSSFWGLILSWHKTAVVAVAAVGVAAAAVGVEDEAGEAAPGWILPQ
jgi:hypothetical protein